MAFYPAFLDLSRKDCLVIGGGELALHKTRAFVELGATVTVVAPRVKPDFARLRGVRVVRRAFRPSDVSGRPWLVVAATDDEALHARVAALCRKRRIWVNVVDRPPLCDFIVPSVTRRGPVTFAVSTGGASPAVAKYLGAAIRRRFGPEVGRLVTELKKLRSRLLAVPMVERRATLTGLVNDRWVSRFKKEGPRAAAAFRRRAADLLDRSARAKA